jgi:hypothetical protein
MDGVLRTPGRVWKPDLRDVVKLASCGPCRVWNPDLQSDDDYDNDYDNDEKRPAQPVQVLVAPTARVSGAHSRFDVKISVWTLPRTCSLLREITLPKGFPGDKGRNL